MDALFSLLFCIFNAIAFEGPSNISRDGGDSGSNGQQGKPMRYSIRGNSSLPALLFPTMTDGRPFAIFPF